MANRNPRDPLLAEVERLVDWSDWLVAETWDLLRRSTT